MLMVLAAVLSCKKDDNSTANPEPIPGGNSDYTIIIESSANYQGVLLDADAQSLTLNSAESSFAEAEEPELRFLDGSILSFYNSTGDCSGTLTKFNFDTETANSITLFSDLGACNLTAHAVAHAGETAYIAYGIEATNEPSQYFVRVIDMNRCPDE